MASMYLKYLFYYIKNGNFKKFLKTKSDQNILVHQNTPNCTIKKNCREPSSKTHVASRHANFPF